MLSVSSLPPTNGIGELIEAISLSRFCRRPSLRRTWAATNRVVRNSQEDTTTSDRSDDAFRARTRNTAWATSGA